MQQKYRYHFYRQRYSQPAVFDSPAEGKSTHHRENVDARQILRWVDPAFLQEVRQSEATY